MNIPAYAQVLRCVVVAALLAVGPAAGAKVSAESLHVTESQVTAAVARVLPCTVALVSTQTGATGSGVLVSEDGLILTAGHVTRATGDELYAILPTGRRVRVQVLGANYGRDASMAKITDPGPFAFVDLGDSDSLEIDQWCLALGHAGGFQRDRSAPIRLGRVLGKNLVGYLATDCTLIGGDSGGPLFDLDGRLIGIHSNIGSSLSENHHVPIAVYRQDWDRLLAGERWGRLLGARMPKDAEDQVESSDDEADAASESSESGPQDDADKSSRDEVEQRFRELVELARREGQSLELTPEMLQELGGMGRFMQRMQAYAEELKPQEMARLLGIRFGEDTFFMEIIEAYRPIIASSSDSVYPLFRGDRPVALATVVDSDGYLLTKASEIGGDKVEMEIGDKRIPAKLLRKFPDYDLAVLKVNARLTPVTWHEGQDALPLGTFLSAVGPEDTPLAVGLLSVAQRNLSGRDKPFLGVALAETDGGLRISGVQRRTAAEKAGLKPGDVIVALDDQPYEDVEAFIAAIQTRRPGQQVRIGYRRDGKQRTVEATLGDRSSLPANPRLERYPQGGRLSKNRDGYPHALQTDLPIEPQQCGSPLVGLDGRALGINIARAGRIKSYAIPADVIQDLLADVIPAPDAVTLPTDQTSPETPAGSLSVAP
jgi:S1-C subfamily serine protease